MYTAGQRVSLTITGPGPSFASSFHFFLPTPFFFAFLFLSASIYMYTCIDFPFRFCSSVKLIFFCFCFSTFTSAVGFFFLPLLPHLPFSFNIHFCLLLYPSTSTSTSPFCCNNVSYCHTMNTNQHKNTVPFFAYLLLFCIYAFRLFLLFAFHFCVIAFSMRPRISIRALL